MLLLGAKFAALVFSFVTQWQLGHTLASMLYSKHPVLCFFNKIEKKQTKQN